MALDRDQQKIEWVNLRRRLTGEQNDAFFAGEYEKLLADPRIDTITISTDAVSLETVPVVWKGDALRHDGSEEIVQVYLGRYSIVLRPGPVEKGLRVNCIASGRYDGKIERPNLYPHHNFGFCFGSRKEYLEQLLAHGEYYGLLCSVLECLWHLNRNITVIELEPYRRVADQDLVELADKLQLPGAAPWTSRIQRAYTKIISLIRSCLLARAA